MTNFGLYPIFGLIASFVFFIVFSFLLFFKTRYAPYIYCFICLSILSPLNEKKRNDFLIILFKRANWRKIRLIENLVIVLPFSLILAIKSQYVFAVSLLLVGSLLSFFINNYILKFPLPTPFGKRPFEFMVGFRKTFLLILFYYFLCIMAILYDNFNLGLFALMITVLTTLGFYNTVEPGQYLSMYNKGAESFLWHKVSIAFKHLLLLLTPILIMLTFVFPQELQIVFLCTFLGCCYILMMIIAKYKSYPKDIDLLTSIVLTLSIVIPVFMLFTIPFFYKKSVQNLQMQ